MTAQQKTTLTSPGSALQGFGLDVFGLGSPTSLAGGPSPTANQQGSPILGPRIGTGGGLQQPGIGMGLQQPNMAMGFQQPVMGIGQQPVLGMGLQQPPSAVSPLNADPLAVLNDLFIPLDSIQPGTYFANLDCLTMHHVHENVWDQGLID